MLLVCILLFFIVAYCIPSCFLYAMTKRENLTKPISLRLHSSVRNTIKTLSDDTGLMQAQLYDLVLRAGCKAIEENNHEFHMPLKFQLK